MLMISLPVIFALVCTVSNTLLAMCGVYDPLHLMIRSHWLQIFGAREPFPRIILNMKQKQMWRINLATELFEIVDSDSDADGDSNDGGDGGNDDKDNNDGLGDLPWRGAIFPLGAFWAVIPVILCVAPPKNYLEWPRPRARYHLSGLPIGLIKILARLRYCTGMQYLSPYQ